MLLCSHQKAFTHLKQKACHHCHSSERDTNRYSYRSPDVLQRALHKSAHWRIDAETPGRAFGEDKSGVVFFILFPVKAKHHKNIRTSSKIVYCYGSSFSETTRDCRLRLAALTKTIERQEGAHHGRRTLCSPFKQATFIRLNSLQRVMKSPHFMWQRLINRSICSVVNMDMPSKYSPLTPFSLKIWR